MDNFLVKDLDAGGSRPIRLLTSSHIPAYNPRPTKILQLKSNDQKLDSFLIGKFKLSSACNSFAFENQDRQVLTLGM